ncbi:hypothetical protein [Sanguibacter suarezii]|uniref:hypothetical protein n=1 Tax=Sanguibacter suarezii TaxID=60921 RepID=UPI000A45BA92|nr:hypothetical protein [Sanguibacter suarezii]
MSPFVLPGDGRVDPSRPTVPGPALSTVVRRLHQAPADLVLSPGTVLDAAALVADAIDEMTGAPTAPGHQHGAAELEEIREFFAGPETAPTSANPRSRSAALTVWVLVDPAVHAAPALIRDTWTMPPLADGRPWPRSAAIARWATATITTVASTFAPVVDPSAWTATNASREEAARAILRAAGMHPAYETAVSAEARWQSVSTLIQQQVLNQLALEARRAEELAARLRSKAAGEAVTQISHV